MVHVFLLFPSIDFNLYSIIFSLVVHFSSLIVFTLRTHCRPRRLTSNSGSPIRGASLALLIPLLVFDEGLDDFQYSDGNATDRSPLIRMQLGTYQMKSQKAILMVPIPLQ